MNHPASPLHRFIHHTKVIALADRDWQAAEAQRVCGLHVEVKNPNHLLDQHGRKLRDFSSTSYLGLDYHPTILAGAIQGLQDAGTLRVANVRQRCQLTLLEQYENELSELFGACCLSTLSCSAASAAILPLLASGALTGNTAPVMVFDRRAHCSMSRLRALCSDETQVITVPHNDMNVLEDLCKRYAKIVYVADAVYPMGGVADLDSLLYLKDRYGVFLYLDDSHGLSTVGQYGAGSVRPRVPALDDDLLVVASLANAFGASGAAVMFANPRQRQLALRYGAPGNGSQSLNAACIGAGRAAVALHRTGEFSQWQEKLQVNIRFFDRLIQTPQRANGLPIRLIPCGKAEVANRVAGELAKIGFLTAPIFFPLVARHEAALKITLRADMQPNVIRVLCELIGDLLGEQGAEVRH